tara:strand:+ start:916 stop:1368 length:453 start_codon:yes stop_codon:yes gene_type:complete
MKINKLELYDIIKEEVEKQLKEEGYYARDDDDNEAYEGGFHACAAHVQLKETQEEGWVVPGWHTLLENGDITHYTVEFADRIEENIPAEELDVQSESSHMARDDKEVEKGRESNKKNESIDHSVGQQKTKELLEGKKLVRRVIPKSPYKR